MKALVILGALVGLSVGGNQVQAEGASSSVSAVPLVATQGQDSAQFQNVFHRRFYRHWSEGGMCHYSPRQDAWVCREDDCYVNRWGRTVCPPRERCHINRYGEEVCRLWR